MDDLALVEAAAREYREDLRPFDPVPKDFGLGEAYSAAQNLGVPGIPAATDRPDLTSIKKLGAACREWLRQS